MLVALATSSLSSQHLTELGFAIALAATLWRRYWGHSAFLALALAESHANIRYPFHGWVRDVLLGQHLAGGDKHVLQSTLIYVSIMAGLAVFVLLIPMLVRASPGRRLMLGGTAVIIAVLALELISPHKLDAVIYHAHGPFTRAAIAYFLGATAIAGGALFANVQNRPEFTSEGAA